MVIYKPYLYLFGCITLNSYNIVLYVCSSSTTCDQSLSLSTLSSSQCQVSGKLSLTPSDKLRSLLIHLQSTLTLNIYISKSLLSTWHTKGTVATWNAYYTLPRQHSVWHMVNTRLLTFRRFIQSKKWKQDGLPPLFGGPAQYWVLYPHRVAEFKCGSHAHCGNFRIQVRDIH